MASREGTDGPLRVILIVLAVLILFPILMMSFAFPMIGMMGWWGGGGTQGTPLWGFGMMLVWLVILVGLGYIIYRAVSPDAMGPDDPALEELRLAYARGELTDEEFETRLERLEDSE